jgi:hypothetical protein
MTDTVSTSGRWTTDEGRQLLKLLEGADSVELKFSVPDADRRSTVEALTLDPLAADMVQVWFFDTPDLDVYAAGVIARARRTRTRDDAAVKLRPVVPDDLPAELRARPGFGVEVDAMPGGFVCSARLKEKLEPGKVRRAMLRQTSPRKLFSKWQRRFFEQFAPSGLTLDDVEPLGPINALKLKFVPAGLDRRLVAELWTYPDGSRILELSTKCAPESALAVAAESRAFLEERGLDMSAAQQTKTKTALEYFAQELREDPAT